jgi:hypothetical protein
MKTTAAILALLAGLGTLGAHRADRQSSPAESQGMDLFSRHYVEGEKLSYHMKATNKDRLKTMRYEAQADGVVKKDAAGHYYEEYQWSGVVWNGQAAQVPPDFRQILSLDPGSRPQVPDLQHAGSALAGPTLDLFTFYVDLIMALRHPGLNRAGDHIYVKFGRPSSWAAGQNQILGESSIDFDLTLQDVDRSKNIATLLVRHVPPAQSQVELPAAWMHTPVVDTPNNWVSVRKGSNGKYVAAVGNETFDDVIQISLTDGRVLSATMGNLVEVLERVCDDAALTACGAPTRYPIRRRITIYSVGDRGFYGMIVGLIRSFELVELRLYSTCLFWRNIPSVDDSPVPHWQEEAAGLPRRCD